MRVVKIEKLTHESFAPFGEFYSMTKPSGYSFALNDDMVIHAAPASNGKPVPDLVKAFCVPMGTMVKLKTAIWHLAPLPVTKEELQALIILPECTYANDCTVVDLKEEEQYCLA